LCYFFPLYSSFSFFHDRPTTEIYTLSLHDALPIYAAVDAGLINGYPNGTFRPDQKITHQEMVVMLVNALKYVGINTDMNESAIRSEEHTSELQSRENLVCRLLLEKKKKQKKLQAEQ